MPQTDLPPRLSGGADAWDSDAGSILLQGYFGAGGGGDPDRAMSGAQSLTVLTQSAAGVIHISAGGAIALGPVGQAVAVDIMVSALADHSLMAISQAALAFVRVGAVGSQTLLSSQQALSGAAAIAGAAIAPLSSIGQSAAGGGIIASVAETSLGLLGGIGTATVTVSASQATAMPQLAQDAIANAAIAAGGSAILAAHDQVATASVVMGGVSGASAVVLATVGQSATAAAAIHGVAMATAVSVSQQAVATTPDPTRLVGAAGNLQPVTQTATASRSRFNRRRAGGLAAVRRPTAVAARTNWGGSSSPVAGGALTKATSPGVDTNWETAGQSSAGAWRVVRNVA